MRHFLRPFVLVPLLAAAAFVPSTGRSQDHAVRYLDEGPAWTDATRARYYTLDQGSELIPATWLRALRQVNGMLFLEGSLARYGYLPDPSNKDRLPVGFSLADTSHGAMVGLTCAACHTRQITVDKTEYRIDGGPAFADFGRLVTDLDGALLRTLATQSAFETFAGDVLGTKAKDPAALTELRGEVTLWSTRLHVLVLRAFPQDKPWGPSRLDAMGLIYDFLVGTDIGPAPTYLIPDNIVRVDAPVRYPFLWNEFHQDFNQWGGFQKNGTDVLALARNLGEVIGVFATFHPKPLTPGAPLNVDYVSANSANFAGLQAAEGLVKLMGPPRWPWPVDAGLAAQGKIVFDRPTDQGGCVACHGVAPGVTRHENATWRTPILDVGTDTRQWKILLRTAQTGALKSATIPTYYGPLKDRELAINILKVAVVGAVEDYQAEINPTKSPPPPSPKTDKVDTNPSTPAGSAPTVVNGYEARVLEGIWAAAPYLHNGSVPALADLLKPAADRPKSFAIGPVYDTANIGLATAQAAGTFTEHSPGCEARDDGDSHCGHEYGTSLPAADKRALLEYLKTL